ncbi:MliC family protein [Ciceribacter ferrooxidans]|uniref:C-type lysozyme inhibitor domain-containing protein n=1 Tax=Ciceribacter ferrooxidans TaxID=2509717 RepID=A0A4Q2TFV9_9HYPH|nr:MliC family protein [Ciceribacter ferrooxidans]RYC17580.1 hypothetical protein EUU22_06245 [Ciceribacter ferrooxidans]
MIRRLRVIAGLVAFAAPAMPAMAEDVPTAVYKCDGGSTFTVRFENDTAYVSFPDGKTYDLPVAISGDGFRYEADGVELRGRGEDATLTVPGTAPLVCRAEDAD